MSAPVLALLCTTQYKTAADSIHPRFMALNFRTRLRLGNAEFVAEPSNAQPLFQLAIRPGEAVMLAKVFRPGAHDKRLEITVYLFEVSTNSPSRSAVTASEASVLVHGFDELRSPLRGYVVFNGDQDRATSIGIGIDDSRQAPMIPRRQINARVRHAPKKA